MPEYPIFNCKNSDDVVKAVREHKIELVQFWFVDVLGTLKSFQVLPGELEAAFEEGMGFDGSSLEGFCRIEESDMIAIPDPATFQLVTWRQTAAPIARMFCDILEPNGTPFAGDSRHCLKRNLQAAASKGYSFYVGPELEFFLFESSTSPKPLDAGGYFDAPPLDLAGDIRREIISCLRSMGIPVEYGHHEVAPSQHELALRYTDALKMADTAITYRVVVKEIARQNGCYATFMPKPLYGENGSGMHVHQSLFKNGRNLFYDADGDHHLSREAKSYIAGLLKHCKEFTAITNQWVNSYKRLVPGFEAPTNIAWARRNRSTLVRVPMYKPGKEAATRVELRSPDPACNPYLTFACMLAAGLKGIEENYALSAPVEEDVYNMTAGDRRARGIESLPGSLEKALEAMEGSTLIREALGEHIFTKFLANKHMEWDQYRSQVTNYELERYLPRL